MADNSVTTVAMRPSRPAPAPPGGRSLPSRPPPVPPVSTLEPQRDAGPDEDVKAALAAMASPPAAHRYIRPQPPGTSLLRYRRRAASPGAVAPRRPPPPAVTDGFAAAGLVRAEMEKQRREAATLDVLMASTLQHLPSLELAVERDKGVPWRTQQDDPLAQLLDD